MQHNQDAVRCCTCSGPLDFTLPQHLWSAVHTFLAQYMRRKPCILPCTVICFWDAFHRSSCVSAFSSWSLQPTGSGQPAWAVLGSKCG